MTDYKPPRNCKHQIDFDPVRDSNPIATVFWIVVYLALACYLGHVFVQAVITEQENEEKYSRPAAFRKASPTHEQMWALDHLTNVSRVAHAERQQP